MFKKVNILLVVSIGLLVAVLITIPVVKACRLSAAYKKAERQIAAGAYREAIYTLKEIEDNNYKDTVALRLLCDAHIKYDRGQYVDAYNTLNEATFKHLSRAQKKSVDNFKNELKTEFDAYTEWEQREYDRKLALGLPFVGMAESEIRNTSLGQPSDYVHESTAMVDGKAYYSYTYYFLKDGKLIYSARCVQGKVVEIRDDRNKKTGSSRPKTGTSSSEPSVEGFSHPEDFYEYYWEDFFEYADAEDYYYEHGGR
jgi:hypothetical protein